MKVYNKDKTQILETFDLSLGKLESDVIQVDEVSEIKERYHTELTQVNDEGGKIFKKVIDVQGRPYQPAHTEEILVYIPYTQQELEEIEIEKLRLQREDECFSIINRGQLWYVRLTEEQKSELETWYQAWLDITVTKIVPQKPNWLK